MNKTVRIFDTPIGLIVVIAFQFRKQPSLPVAATRVSAWPQPTPRPVTMGNLEPFVKSGVVR